MNSYALHLKLFSQYFSFIFVKFSYICFFFLKEKQKKNCICFTEIFLNFTNIFNSRSTKAVCQTVFKLSCEHAVVIKVVTYFVKQKYAQVTCVLCQKKKPCFSLS